MKKFPWLLLLSSLAGLRFAAAHGTLVNDRMYQVRVAGPNGHSPATWNETYYTWNQNSHNFPNYAAIGFSYSTTVPDATIAYAGINDGVQTALNFTGLATPSTNWIATPATAGQSFALHYVATAPHNPSYFEVYLTKQGFEVATDQLSWGMLENLGRWSLNDPTHPVTNATAPSPSGGSSLSYDWAIPIPANRSGRHVVVVIWQRQDPAGEAFFAVQDITVAAAAPEFTIATTSDNQIRLQLEAAPNEQWVIKKRVSLTNGSWFTYATGTTNAQGVMEVTDSPAGGVSFYRAEPP